MIVPAGATMYGVNHSRDTIDRKAAHEMPMAWTKNLKAGTLIGSGVLSLLVTVSLLIRPFRHHDYERVTGMLRSMRSQDTTPRMVVWTLALLAIWALLYWAIGAWKHDSRKARWWALGCAAFLSWTLTIPGSNSDGHTWYGAPEGSWSSARLLLFYAYRWAALTAVLTLLLAGLFARYERTAAAQADSAAQASACAPDASRPGDRLLGWLRLRASSVFALAGAMFVCWIPILVLDGPAHIFIDTTEQITMYRERQTLAWMDFLRPRGSWLNDQHPFVDTLLYGAVDDIGRAMGHELLAFAILTWIQTACCAIALSALICWVFSRTTLPRAQRWLVLFICCFVPVFPLNMALVMKDSTWMPFFLAWLVTYCEAAYRILSHKRLSGGLLAAMIAFSILAGFTKKTSPYLTFAATLCLLLAMAGRRGGLWDGRSAWQIAVSAFCAPILVLGIVPATLYAPLRISTGNPAETLAVPMQQVTKAFIDHGKEISKSDRKIVEKTMNLEKAERAFRPSSSNTGVKKSYNWDPTATNDFLRTGDPGGTEAQHQHSSGLETNVPSNRPDRRGSTAQSRAVAREHTSRPDTLAFLWVWLRLGLRYPHSYVAAVPYLWDAFVPGRIISRGFGPIRSGRHAQKIFLQNVRIGHYSWTQRVIGPAFMTLLSTVPPFCDLADICAYTVWIPLFGLMECVMRRRWRQLVLLVPTALLLAIQMVIQVAEVRLSLGFLCVFPLAFAAAWMRTAPARKTAPATRAKQKADQKQGKNEK